ncbi:MAG: biotin synthase BioB [Desulfuromonadaceae bacterium]|nr:biotin synthase BioB [Desulfuromonadaceae bacterium]
MSDTARFFLRMADDILAGRQPPMDSYLRLAGLRDEEVLHLLPAADRLRHSFCGRCIHLCTIVNAKSGQCSENCAFCAQSRFSRNPGPVYPLKSPAMIREQADKAQNSPIHRFSLVTSGKGLCTAEIETILAAVSDLKKDRLAYCASLGLVAGDTLVGLKEAGVSRYHHNLETSRSFYPAVCTTHSWEERAATVREAKKAGLSVCSGGIFGLGESDEQRLELALELKNLSVDAVPINFLTPIPGTPLESADFLTPWRCLKIIALFRFVLPDREILVCGGRERNLRSLHPLVFSAGASGIMTGHYLTTEGRQLHDDLEMLRELGFMPRQA